MFKIMIMLFLSVEVSAYRLERNLSKEIVVKQRKYSSEKIYSMLLRVEKNSEDCSISLELLNPGFSITNNGHDFYFDNFLEYGERADRSSYECLLVKDKRKLECERRLPRESNSIFQQSDVYVRLTINLDEAGNAISMHGVKSRKYNIAGHVLPNLLERTITEFKCDVQPQTVVKDAAVSDKIRNTDSTTNLPNGEEGQGSTSTAK